MSSSLSQTGGQLKLVAVSSPFSEQAFTQGIDCLKTLVPGIDIALPPLVYAEETNAISALGHLAGSDEERAELLNQALTRPGLVMMVRGGFGVSRLLRHLNWRAIKQAQPRVIGFSDFSALLNPLAEAGLVGIHGPSLTQLPHLEQTSLQELAMLLTGRLKGPRVLTGSQVVGSNAKGKLMGGNLSMLCHLMGTEFAPDFNEKILTIEEVNEPPYALDRLLTQLELADVPSKVAGIALGDLHGWHEEISSPHKQARYDLASCRLKAWNKPLLLDLPFGHAQRNRLLSIGAMAEIADGRLIMEI